MLESLKTVSFPELKALPAEQQRVLGEKLRNRTKAKAQAELRRQGLRAAPAELERFGAWWRRREQFRQAQEATLDYMELLGVQQPRLAAEAIARYGHRRFQMLALEQEAAPDFLRFQAAHQRALADTRRDARGRAALSLQREKFEFDAAAACLRQLPALQAIERNGQLSRPEKLDEIRRLLFGAELGLEPGPAEAGTA